MEGYSRTRWLDKHRPAGAPHTGGWAGGPDGTCRGHWLIPLLKKYYISRFVRVILAPVHAILLCIIQANYFRHPYAGALLSSARADVEIFSRRHCRRTSKKLARAQANVPSRFQSRVEHANSIRLSHTVVHHRSSTISRILQFTPRNCTHKKNVPSQGPCCSNKTTICALSVHAQPTQVSFMSSQATLHQGRVNLYIVQI